MMTSSNGSIFRVTGPLCGEFTGPGEFPTQRPVTRSFDVFFDLRLNKRLSKQPWGWWFEPPSWSLWRHRNAKVPWDLRLCLVCGVVEDGEHFVTNCSITQAERRSLYSKISCKVPCFSTLSDFDKFLYLLKNNDPQILTWFGKFVHQSFITHNIFFCPKWLVRGSRRYEDASIFVDTLGQSFECFFLLRLLCNTV